MKHNKSPRYNWNVVERGIKHHNSNPRHTIITCVEFSLWLAKFLVSIFKTYRAGGFDTTKHCRKGHTRMTQFYFIFMNDNDLCSYWIEHILADRIDVRDIWRKFCLVDPFNNHITEISLTVAFNIITLTLSMIYLETYFWYRNSMCTIYKI